MTAEQAAFPQSLGNDGVDVLLQCPGMSESAVTATGTLLGSSAWPSGGGSSCISTTGAAAAASEGEIGNTNCRNCAGLVLLKCDSPSSSLVSAASPTAGSSCGPSGSGLSASAVGNSLILHSAKHAGCGPEVQKCGIASGGGVDFGGGGGFCCGGRQSRCHLHAAEDWRAEAEAEVEECDGSSSGGCGCLALRCCCGGAGGGSSAHPASPVGDCARFSLAELHSTSERGAGAAGAACGGFCSGLLCACCCASASGVSAALAAEGCVSFARDRTTTHRCCADAAQDVGEVEFFGGDASTDPWLYDGESWAGDGWAGGFRGDSSGSLIGGSTFFSRGGRPLQQHGRMQLGVGSLLLQLPSNIICEAALLGGAPSPINAGAVAVGVACGTRGAVVASSHPPQRQLIVPSQSECGGVCCFGLLDSDSQADAVEQLLQMDSQSAMQREVQQQQSLAAAAAVAQDSLKSPRSDDAPQNECDRHSVETATPPPKASGCFKAKVAAASSSTTTTTTTTAPAAVVTGTGAGGGGIGVCVKTESKAQSSPFELAATSLPSSSCPSSCPSPVQHIRAATPPPPPATSGDEFLKALRSAAPSVAMCLPSAALHDAETSAVDAEVRSQTGAHAAPSSVQPQGLPLGKRQRGRPRRQSHPSQQQQQQMVMTTLNHPSPQERPGSSSEACGFYSQTVPTALGNQAFEGSAALSPDSAGESSVSAFAHQQHQQAKRKRCSGAFLRNSGSVGAEDWGLSTPTTATPSPSASSAQPASTQSLSSPAASEQSSVAAKASSDLEGEAGWTAGATVLICTSPDASATVASQPPANSSATARACSSVSSSVPPPAPPAAPSAGHVLESGGGAGGIFFEGSPNAARSSGAGSCASPQSHGATQQSRGCCCCGGAEGGSCVCGSGNAGPGGGSSAVNLLTAAAVLEEAGMAQAGPSSGKTQQTVPPGGSSSLHESAPSGSATAAEGVCPQLVGANEDECLSLLCLSEASWQQLRSQGVFKLGDKGRAVIKSRISRQLRTFPHLRKKAAAVAGVRCATTKQLFQLAQICGLYDVLPPQFQPASYRNSQEQQLLDSHPQHELHDRVVDSPSGSAPTGGCFGTGRTLPENAAAAAGTAGGASRRGPSSLEDPTAATSNFLLADFESANSSENLLASGVHAAATGPGAAGGSSAATAAATAGSFWHPLLPVQDTLQPHATQQQPHFAALQQPHFYCGQQQQVVVQQHLQPQRCAAYEPIAMAASSLDH